MPLESRSPTDLQSVPGSGAEMEKDKKGVERTNAEIERREPLSIRTAKTCRDDFSAETPFLWHFSPFNK